MQIVFENSLYRPSSYPFLKFLDSAFVCNKVITSKLIKLVSNQYTFAYESASLILCTSASPSKEK